MPVLDASVYVAYLSPYETHHERARTIVEPERRRGAFWVPRLFQLEVVAAFVRRGESPRFLRAVESAVAGPTFRLLPVTDRLVDRATAVVRQTGLRAYDGVYAALALTSRLPFVTFDRDVQRRLKRAYPRLVVVGA